jgi:hypothetical protein
MNVAELWHQISQQLKPLTRPSATLSQLSAISELSLLHDLFKLILNCGISFFIPDFAMKCQISLQEDMKESFK